MFPYCFYIWRTFLCYVRGPLMTNNSNGNESGIFLKVSKSSSSFQTSCHAAVHSVVFSITSFAFYEPDSNVCGCLVGESCPTLLQCCGLQPSELLCPWDSQARILQWVTMSFSRGLPTQGSHLTLLPPALAGGYLSATWEAPKCMYWVFILGQQTKSKARGWTSKMCLLSALRSSCIASHLAFFGCVLLLAECLWPASALPQPQSMCWRPNGEDDGIGRWSLRAWLDYEGGAPMGGICVLMKEAPKS